MRQGMIALVLLIAGCQELPILNRWETAPPASLMPLWEHYRRCLVETDPVALIELVEQFEAIEQQLEVVTWQTPSER